MNTQSFSFPKLTWTKGQDEAGGPPPAPETRSFVVIIGAVALLAALYYAIIAAPMYVSKAEFTIQAPQSPTATNILAGLIAPPPGIADDSAVHDYIQSPEMLQALDQQFSLRKAYSRFRIDIFNWLPPTASDHDFLNFYHRMVTVDINTQANIVNLQVRSFDHDSAAPIAQLILQKAERFVDGMTQRMRNETVVEAKNDLDQAVKDVQTARNAVASYRGATASVDPSMAGATVQSTQAALDAQAIAIQAQLASALTYNKPDSPPVQQLQASLKAVREQSAKFKAQQEGGPGSGLPKQVTSYEVLTVERAAAEAKVVTAQGAYEAARDIAQQHTKYVVRVVEPNTPDRPTEPERIRDFLMIMVFAIAGYGIISLAIAGINDHRGV